MSKKEERKDLFARQDGRFTVMGTVFLGSIQERSNRKSGVKNGKPVKGGKTSNVVKSVGYLILDNKTGKKLFMDKMEAIYLVKEHGVTNATIRPRKQKTRDDVGTVVSEGVNLNLHPIKTERPFTDADRLFPIFKLDRNGRIIRPVELVLKEEDCTDRLWEFIMSEYKKRKPRSNTKSHPAISDEERLKRIARAFDAVNFEPPVDVPFDQN